MSREFWKVCKRLANEERIDVLRQVLCSPSPTGISVGEVAGLVRLEQPSTSIYLTQLQNECGLVASTRQGRYCVYRAEADCEDANAIALLPALREFFCAEARGFVAFNGRRPPAPAFLSVLPALANKSRVQVVRFLRSSARGDKWGIVNATKVSEINVKRHIRCLERCRLLKWDGRQVVWQEPVDGLSRLFIRMAVSQ